MLTRLKPDEAELRVAMTTALMPCPWCGRHPVMWTEKNEASGLFVSKVACADCFVSMSSCMETREAAQKTVVERWSNPKFTT